MGLMELVEQLNSSVSPGGIRGPHRDSADDVIDALIEAFCLAQQDQRAAARSAMSVTASLLLLHYAWIRAADAVRQGSGEMVKRGLTALAIEDGRLDAHESQIQMAVLFRSAEKLGIDAAQAFNDAADLATHSLLQSAMCHFPLRSPEQRDLKRAFYINEKTGDEGFMYEFDPQAVMKNMRRKVRWLRLRKFFRRNH